MAASCSDRLRVGFAKPVGGSDWVRWRRLIVILLMVIVVVTEKCSAEESGIKDCVVYHLPYVYFFKNLTVGFLPETSKNALKGLRVSVMTSEGLKYVDFDHLKLTGTCIENNRRKPSIDSFTSNSSLDGWTHLRFSVRDGDLIIGQTKVCQSLPDGKKLLKISTIASSNDVNNVVFNCEEGCPVYMNTTSLVKYNARPNDTKIYVKRLKLNGNATAQLSLVNCSLRRTDCKEIPTSHRNFSTNISDWELLNDVNLELKSLPDTGSNRAIFLNLTGSKGTSWSLNCDPRRNKCKDPTLPIPKTENEEIKQKAYWKTVGIGLLVTMISLVIILVTAICGLLVMQKRLASTKVRVSQSRNQSSPSTGAFSRNTNLENNDLSKPLSPPPTVPSLPNSGACSPHANHFSEEDPDYADPRDMMRPQMLSRKESSNYVEPFNSLTRNPPQNTKTISVSSPPAEDNDDEEDHDYDYIDHEALMKQLNKDKDEEERRKTMVEDGGELTRHESVNSLYEELKMKE